MTFVAGPLLVGALVRYAPPAAGVAPSALLVTAGTITFVTSPAVSRAHTPAEHLARSKGRLRGARGLVQPVLVASVTVP